MADDEARKPPQGTVVMQAVIRPAKESPSDAPISSTVAMPVVPEPNVPGGGMQPTQQSALPLTECPTCKTLTPVAKFCSECGAALTKRRFCAECGSKLDPGSKFCEACGTRVP